MLDFEELDYYALLGVTRSASADEIKRAYRREIAKYHPDRLVQAEPDEREYAALRAQRLNDAYRILSDFRARNDYNRSSQPRVQRVSQSIPQRRDHQAELYEQASVHLAAGRPLQAIAALRQLQRLNPLYRDSAELLADAKAQLEQRAEGEGLQGTGLGRQRLPRRMVVISGVGGVLATAVVLVWSLGRMPSLPLFGNAEVPSVLPTLVPSVVPIATDTLTPTTEPSPTIEPTTQPTDKPLPSATPAPTKQPTAIALGEPLLFETFARRTWAEQGGRGWQVGYVDNAYRIRADVGVGAIWSYRTGPDGDLSYSVDMQHTGESGLLLRFRDEGDYITCTLDSSRGVYRVLQQVGGVESILAEGRSDLIKQGSDVFNQLEVQVSGKRLRVYVDGAFLVEAEVSELSSSTRYGLVTVAGDVPSVATFDNLEIRALQP